MVLPDPSRPKSGLLRWSRLNAPTSAWCSLTTRGSSPKGRGSCLNAPAGAWCSLTLRSYDSASPPKGLNAPTGAWCSLTGGAPRLCDVDFGSQCTYRCVVLPDKHLDSLKGGVCQRLNAPTGAWCSLTQHRHRRWCPPPSQCTYRCVVLPDSNEKGQPDMIKQSQCTYRCVVLPDL